MNGSERNRILLGGLVVLAALGQTLTGFAQELPAQPRDFVVDLAGVIDRPTFQRLNGFLVELEQKTGTQIIVLTVNSTGGVPIRDFGLQTGEKWKLGRKGKDNGVLIVIAVKDRQWTFEVGYGLEPMLPDSFCGRVGREVFVPHFKKGQYGQGIFEGTLVLANKVANAAGVQIAGMTARTLPRQTGGAPATGAGGLFACAFPVFIIFFFVLLARNAHMYRNRRYTSGLWLWLLLGGLGGGRHGGRNWGGWGGGGWGGGGGFGGGGFGGGSFGGGGGGSFGGGGASGGW